MADALMEFLNDAGRVMLTTKSKTLVRKASGTHTFSTNAQANTFYGAVTTRLDVTIGPVGLIAIRPVVAGELIGLQYMTRSGGVSSYYLFSTTSTSPSLQVEWWAYDMPEASSTLNIRADFFTPAGEVAWQLYEKPMRIANVLQQTIDAAPAPFLQSVNEPAGRKYAIAIGMRAGALFYQEIGTPDGQPTRYRSTANLDAVRWNAGTPNTLDIRVSNFDRAAGFTTSPPGPTYYSPRNALVLDVTDH